MSQGISPMKRKEVFKKFGGRCAYCGEGHHKLCVDHIIPKINFYAYIKSRFVPGFLTHLTLDDMNHIDNLFPACQSCNGYKSAFDLETFRREVGLLMERLNLRFNQYKIAKRFNLVKETKIEVKFYFETLNENKLHKTSSIQVPN